MVKTIRIVLNGGTSSVSSVGGPHAGSALAHAPRNDLECGGSTPPCATRLDSLAWISIGGGASSRAVPAAMGTVSRPPHSMFDRRTRTTRLPSEATGLSSSLRPNGHRPRGLTCSVGRRSMSSSHNGRCITRTTRRCWSHGKHCTRRISHSRRPEHFVWPRHSRDSVGRVGSGGRRPDGTRAFRLRVGPEEEIAGADPR
jgi:hypothetical protein